MSEPLDPRLTPARPHVADLRLRDRVTAARYVAGTPLRVTAPSAPLRREPNPGAGLDTEALPSFHTIKLPDGENSDIRRSF